MRIRRIVFDWIKEDARVSNTRKEKKTTVSYCDSITSPVRLEWRIQKYCNRIRNQSLYSSRAVFEVISVISVTQEASWVWGKRYLGVTSSVVKLSATCFALVKLS